MLSGNHITMGGVTNPQNRLDNYGKSRLTLSWGKESYAVANTALALGDHSIAAGDTSIATGLYSIAYGAQSLAAGGASVRTIGTRSAAFNSGAEAGGRASLAANINTVTGGMPYNFYTGVTWEEQETAIHCNYVYDTVGNIPMVVASNEYGMRIEEIPIDYSGSGNAVIDVPDPRSLKGCYYVVEQPADNEWSSSSEMDWYYSPISGMNRTAELVLNPILHGKYDVTVPDYIDTPYGTVNHWAVDHFEVNWASLLRGGDDFYIRADKAFKINDQAIGQISCDANTWYRVEVITEVRNIDTYPSTMNYYRVTSI